MSRLELFPNTTKIEKNTLTIAGLDLAALSEEYGTPLYLYDQATLGAAAAGYQSALRKHYHGKYNLTYAGKAFLCLAIAEWVNQHDMWLDCTGLGEITIATAAGVPRERLLVHGVNKTPADLEVAISSAGVIVVDNLDELKRLIELSRSHQIPELWLRFQPGVTIETHAFTETGHTGSKFGMTAEEIIKAASRCVENGLTPRGLHFHLGSQFRDPIPLGPAIKIALDLAEKLHLDAGWTLSPGGGWGVAYHEDDLPQPNVSQYVSFIAKAVENDCRQRHLVLPQLQLEPGRSLVARAGVALYRVGAIKSSAGQAWVLVDGGMADNPRPALYGTRYSALPVRGPGREAEGPVNIAGPYCESGDVMIESLPMPKIEVGDIIAIPASGAYQASMSSNYNGARRPAILWLDNGRAQIIRERETPEDLFDHDHRLVKPVGRG